MPREKKKPTAGAPINANAICQEGKRISNALTFFSTYVVQHQSSCITLGLYSVFIVIISQLPLFWDDACVCSAQQCYDGSVARKSASHMPSAQANLSREWLMISLSTFLVSLSACKRHQTNIRYAAVLGISEMLKCKQGCRCM